MPISTPQERIPDWNANLAGADPEAIIRWAGETFPGKVAFATSLGLEDQVLTDIIVRAAAEIRVFTLDTGRLFPETYDLIERTASRYGIDIHIRFPDADEVREMTAREGVNLFLKSVELRKECCRVRKIHPLRKELASLDAWIVGLRAEQSVTREGLDVVEWDEPNGLVKISPLAGWTLEEIEAYTQSHDVPCSPLHAKGFPSIGCACCTRAVGPGEDVRAGRWWWERPENKECGLHGRFTKDETE